ncbi:thioredoxin [Nocardia tenerifensis]|uniref:Thioredoxin n=1 Tax=Nocardia tenerifensis TaxID=228006 RepID=A0A318K123_9NOCA|nr:thioredoxin domain-containing protein [Nocardia tenerifensis]PXX60855.1 thioredoxin [Nocardia tenerifensis]
MAIEELIDPTFDRAVARTVPSTSGESPLPGKPLIVLFYAPFSAAAMYAKASFAQLAAANDGHAAFAAIDAGEHRVNALKFGIDEVPMILVFEAGAHADTIRGVLSAAELAPALARFL